MSRRYWRVTCALALIASVGMAAPARADDPQPLKLNKIQSRLLSGYADLQLNGERTAQTRRAQAQATPDTSDRPSDSDTGGDNRARPFYFPTEDDLCPQNRGSNIKVNQDCQNLSDADFAGRAQAQNEPAINYDPNNSQHLVATFNDYRRGDGNCGGAFSLDGGRNWADIVIPMSFTRGHTTVGTPPVDFGASRQYWTSGGDTSIAWDTRGNAYFSCQVFNRGKPATSNPDVSSAMLVFRSTGNDGASYNFPGRYVTASNDVAGTGLAPFEDKQYLTVDNHPGSPYQDRVYVSWTEFTAQGTGYIWLAYSADYGETFSPRHLVSVTNPTLCTNTYGLPTPEGACNQNQFSQPFTGLDGTLYVVYDNYNNATSNAHGNDGTGEEGVFGPDDAGPGRGGPPPTAVENRNQILLSRSTDGGNTFSTPVKVADYYDLPDCDTYQGLGKDPGRACVPEKGPTANSVFRATNYGSGVVNPTNPHQVVVTFGSYINRFSNEKRPNPCVPTGFAPDGNNTFYGVKTPGACNNKILLSVSNDSGATFTGTTTDARLLPTVNQAPRQVGTDQWWQWAAFTPDGRLAVSYYDRQYGNDEITGYSDFSISGTRDLRNALGVRFGTARVTTGSMPPPTQFRGQFLGDYTGLTAPDQAYPIWADTRNPELFLCPGTGTPGSPPKVCTGTATNASRANDEDIFARAMSIPLPGENNDNQNGDNTN